MSLFRRFRVTEKLQAEFRVEAFNVLNHPNFRLFYSPGAYQSTLTLTSPTFGQITYADDPRLIQVALKLRVLNVMSSPAALAEQVDDIDERRPVNRLVRPLGRDELVGPQ